MYNLDGKVYDMIDGNIVDAKTNILVCNEIATKICEMFGVTIKNETSSRESFDAVYLNSLIKARAKQKVEGK